MAELKASKLREMSRTERDDKLKELKESLLRQRASVAMGGAPLNPGLIRSIRRQIARIETLNHLEEIKR
ncbi:50S ribosomal protein L29 [Cuniculiplasma sp. SKW3]|uniref:50S ribosomal protein L29 n=1 Tax=unclassified Cuniculiplasma TaxID=2619706 RepID=UPI003FD53A60